MKIPSQPVVNAGFVTSLTKTEVSYYGVARTAMHEVAHNLGADHDCCKNPLGQGFAPFTFPPLFCAMGKNRLCVLDR